MTRQKIQVTNEHGAQLGYVLLEGRLPAFLLIDGTLYQRYGRVSDYRYVLEPELYAPTDLEVIRE